jgi:multidrug efflux pump
LRWPFLLILVLAGTVALNIWLYTIVPKGFFPQQDTGRLIGFVRADQSISFQAMKEKLVEFVTIVQQDPAVENVTAFTGGGQRNRAQMFVALKPIKSGREQVDKVMARIRTATSKVPGANLFLSPIQDLRGGGRQADASTQFTLRGDDLNELRTWADRLALALRDVPELTDLNSDQENRGLQMTLIIDRATARASAYPRAPSTPRWASPSGSRSPRPSTRTATSTA